MEASNHVTEMAVQIALLGRVCLTFRNETGVTNSLHCLHLLGEIENVHDTLIHLHFHKIDNPGKWGLQ